MNISFYSNVKRIAWKLSLFLTITGVICLGFLLILNQFIPYMEEYIWVRVITITFLAGILLVYLIYTNIVFSRRIQKIKEQIEYYGELKLREHINHSTIAVFGNKKHPRVYFTEGLLIARDIAIVEYENIDYIYLCQRLDRNARSHFSIRIVLLDGTRYEICKYGKEKDISKYAYICLEQSPEILQFTFANLKRNLKNRKEYKNGAKMLKHIDLSTAVMSPENYNWLSESNALSDHNTNYDKNGSQTTQQEEDIIEMEPELESGVKNIPNIQNHRMYLILSNMTMEQVEDRVQQGEGLGTGKLNLRCKLLPGYKDKVCLEVIKSPQLSYARYYYETQNLFIWVTDASKEQFCFVCSENWKEIMYYSYLEPGNTCEDSVIGIYKGRTFHYCIPDNKFTAGKSGQYSVKSILRKKYNFDPCCLKDMYVSGFCSEVKSDWKQLKW